LAIAASSRARASARMGRRSDPSAVGRRSRACGGWRKAIGVDIHTILARADEVIE
jgi:hypothetical protein